MARFYFHLHERGHAILDEEGLELPDWEAARLKAVEAARSIMSHDVLRGMLSLNGDIEIVADDAAQSVRVPFSDALSVDI